MKSDIVQIVLALLVLVIGGSAEDILPKIAGVGFPVLMSATVFIASRLLQKSIWQGRCAAGKQ